MKNINEKEQYSIIDRILWEQWDPIGLNGDINARNEYYGYIPVILKKLLSGSGKKEIADFLYEVEKNRMGLEGNYTNCFRVAKSIITIMYNNSDSST